MAFMFPIDINALPKGWTLPDTRSMSDNPYERNILDEINESARRVTLMREQFGEEFQSLTIRPEFVAQVRCINRENPDWCSISIASIDMDKLNDLDDSISDEFVHLIDKEGISHATVDYVHTPLDQPNVFLLRRTVDVRDTPRLFAEGVLERLRGVDEDSAKITAPIDASSTEDHSRDIFEKATVYSEYIENMKSTIINAIADNSGFTVLTETGGVPTLAHIPYQTIDMSDEDALDEVKKSRLIAKASSDARSLISDRDYALDSVNWTIFNVDARRRATEPILFGEVKTH